MGRTLLLMATLMPAVVDARPLRSDGSAQMFDVVGTEPNDRGVVLGRQVLPATGAMRAESRTIYLNPNGVILRPGINDSTNDVSSVVTEPTLITAWDTDWDTWEETVDCFKEIYAPFGVTITDEDPGVVPHIEAVFGGSPLDVGLPEDVGGVSPFTTDCAVIERSVVFAFTEVLPDDARTVCEVMAQEVAHSFGLDHELLASDPMTYLTYFGDRTFQNEMASCGEFGGRMCGINGSVCRQRQNSYALLMERLGAGTGVVEEPAPIDEDDDGLSSGITHGCNAGGGSAGLGIALCYLLGGVVRRRRVR